MFGNLVENPNEDHNSRALRIEDYAQSKGLSMSQVWDLIEAGELACFGRGETLWVTAQKVAQIKPSLPPIPVELIDSFDQNDHPKEAALAWGSLKSELEHLRAELRFTQQSLSALRQEQEDLRILVDSLEHLASI